MCPKIYEDQRYQSVFKSCLGKLMCQLRTVERKDRQEEWRLQVHFCKIFAKKQEKSSYQNTKGENVIKNFTLYSR